MVHRRALAALLALIPLAGCAGEAGVEIDLITPGAWHVSGTPERILAWAHNGGDSRVDAAWSLTASDGAPLAAGWNVTFLPARADLGADGTKVGSGGGFSYPDWGWALVTLRVPVDATPGPVRLRLGLGDATRDVTVAVSKPFGNVTGPGDNVRVEYKGRFTHNGTEFDAGGFPTTLGSGETVPGFDYGLMGLAVGETATLVIPPALAYGYDNPPGRLEPFNGRSLTFDVKVASAGLA